MYEFQAVELKVQVTERNVALLCGFISRGYDKLTCGYMYVIARWLSVALQITPTVDVEKHVVARSNMFLFSGG